MRAALGQHIRRRYAATQVAHLPQFAGQTADFGLVTLADAAQLLGVSDTTAVRLVEAGLLSRIAGCDPSLVLRMQVLGLKDTWDAALPLQEAANLIGASHEALQQISRAGFIPALRGPDIDGSPWLFRRTDLLAFLESLALPVAPHGSHVATARTLDLSGAVRMLEGIGGNLLTVIAALREGRLPVQYCTNLGLNGIRLAPRAVAGLRDQIDRANGWIGRIEAARLLGVKHTVLTVWVNRGLLRPDLNVANAWRFSEKALREFQEQNVFHEQAARMLGVHPTTCQRWAREGRFEAVSGPTVDGCHRWLLTRRSVEDVGKVESVTLSKTARLLGANAAAVRQHLEDGSLKPLGGPTVDGTKRFLFSRCDVTALKQTGTWGARPCRVVRPTFTLCWDAAGPVSPALSFFVCWIALHF